MSKQATVDSFSLVLMSNLIRQWETDLDPIDFGRQCKRFIDFSRINYLQSLGFHCSYIPYIDGSVTPENYVILAQRNCCNNY